MISLNLLPDVKKQFLKAQKTRNLIFSFSLFGSAVAIALVILGFVAVLGMRFQINRNENKIQDLQEEYSGIDNLGEILTVRNQATALPDLHDDKPVASRLFKLLSLTTPEEVDLTDVSVDFGESTMELSAVAGSFSGINKYVDTLENTYFKSGDGDSEKREAFSEIVSEQSVEDGKVIATVSLSFTPSIFDSASKVSFSVPDIETTQSVRKKPLFTEQVEEEGEDNE